MSKITLILGASNKVARYAHMAQVRLQETGHEVIPVHPREAEILGVTVISDLGEVWQEVDTITVYVNPSCFAFLLDEVLRIAPKRVVFNPGTEAPELYHEIPEHIEVLEACTLVLLDRGRY